MKARRAKRSTAARRSGTAELRARLRRAQARVRQVEQRYKMVMGAINESVYDWDLVHDRFSVSESMQRVLGLPARLLSLKEWQKRIHPDDYARYRDATVAHLKGITDRFECDYRFRAADGAWRWARTHGLAIRDAKGRAVRMIGSTGNITALKQAEDALRTSEERYALATAAAVEGIYEWDIDTGSLYLTDRAKAFFAFPDQDVTPAAWNTRIHGEDYPRYRAAIVEHFKGRTEYLEVEYRIADASGGYKWVLDRGKAVRGANGRATRMVGALSDITQRKRAEIELRRARDQAEEALEQQTAIAEILKVTISSPTDVQRVFQSILTNASRLCEASFAAIFLYDGDTLSNVAQRNASPEFAQFLRRMRVRPSRKTTTRRCALELRTIHTGDLLNDPEFSPPEDHRRESVRTALSVPMMREGALIGVITLWRREVRPFPDKQIALVQTFADQAVIAIENVRLFNETKEALERQTATAEILRVISSTPTDTQPVFEAIVQSGIKLFNGAAMAVALPDGDQVRAAAIAESDPRRAAAWKERFPFPLTHDYMHGVAILDGRLVDVPDATCHQGEFLPGIKNFLASGYRAATIMPMLRGDVAIGAVSLLRLAPGPLSEKQLGLLKTFADQAVIAIENIRLLNETKEALERQTATAEILRAISSAPTDTQPVFDAIAQSGLRVFAGTGVGIALVQGDRVRVVSAGGDLGVMATQVDMPLSRESASGTSIVDRTAVNITDTEAPDAPRYARDNGRALGFRSISCAPMLREGNAIGAIAVTLQRAGGLSDAHLDLLKTFADQAVIAIENVRLFNETTEALDQQKASAEVLGAIGRSIADASPVFEKILESCQRLFEGHQVGLTLVGEDGQVHLAAHQGPKQDEMRSIYPMPLSRASGTGFAILEGRVVDFPDIASFAPEHVQRGTRILGVKSIIFAPLLVEGKGIGALWVGRLAAGPFGAKQTALLQTFANQAVIAIQNARLFREIEKKSRELEVANRHKSEFLANMSHELRTPLNAIIGFTRIVMRRSKEQLEPKQYENLEKILSSAQHLLALINAILDLSKVEAGRVEVHAGDVQLGPVLEQCMRTVEPLLKAPAVRLMKEFDGELPQVYADEEKLRQIVLNLLGNAVKFTERGTVRVQAKANGDSFSVAVADTGIGISANKLEHVFEEFAQADATSTRVYGGTGLGLTIARRLARLMGGDIAAQSAPGVGSTFTLTLPVRYQP